MNIVRQEEELIVAPWSETKYLVVSSLFFLIPACYASFLQLFSYSFLLTLTSLASANYWRKATYSWRRNMDLVVAKIAFTVFFAKGVFVINYYPYVVSGFFVSWYLFACSKMMWELKDKQWVNYHFLFHVVLTYEQLIILDSIRSVV
jgi:hypothetical protein